MSSTYIDAVFYANDKKLIFAGCHKPKKLQRFCAHKVFPQFAFNFTLFAIHFFAENVDEIDPGSMHPSFLTCESL
jgi:hypothetical protein